MNIDILNGKKHIHFIGIGGSGMYPLAQILHTKGFYLTGSDNNETETLQAVRDMGIPVYLGQRAENIEGADLIVHTAAIMADNPELIAAKASGVPVLERSELLGIVTSWYDNAICVAGTHGKTTTTSMVTQILFTAGVDLSAFIGGKLPCIHGSGRSGSSDIMTCEACEFVDTFLKLYPDIAVLLNIDADHLDYFGTVENIIKSFHKFAQLTSKAVIYNGSDANTCKAMEGITGKECITFGKTADCDYYPANIRHVSGLETHFQLMHRGKELGEIVLHVAGEHNVLNATAAAAAAMYVGVSFADVAKGLCRQTVREEGRSRRHYAGRRLRSPPHRTDCDPESCNGNAVPKGLGSVPAVHFLPHRHAAGRIRRSSVHSGSRCPDGHYGFPRKEHLSHLHTAAG